MYSAAMAEARRRGAPVLPVLAIDYEARGLSLGRGIYSPAIWQTDLGQVTAVTADGGWTDPVYGYEISGNKLLTPEASVDVSDPRRTLIDMLQTYDPRGSAARIDWAARELVEGDWEPAFRGILADWERVGLFTRLIVKTDDTVLRKPVPPGAWLRTEWGGAYDGSIYGTAQPLVMGIHDSYQVTARGAVPLVNIRYDSALGYWWALSADRAVSVDRLYFDGILQGAGGWSVIHGVYGQVHLTIVAFTAGYQPEKDVIVAADCSGPDETGGTAGDPLTGTPDQLRKVLEEHVYRTPPLAGWRGAASIIDATSWDAASEYFALHHFESARRFGADQQPQSAAEVIQSFLDQHPWCRIHWTQLGTLAMVVIDPDDVDPDPAAWLELDKHHATKSEVPFAPGDRREVYTHVRMPYLWLDADQKFASAYEAHDVAALPEKVELPIDAPWSQARLTQDGTLNPAAPADPVHP